MRYKKGEFITIPNRGYLHRLSTGAQSLFMWICVYADGDGLCWPSRATLANRMRCSDRTVDSYLKELIETGFVVKENRVVNNEKQSNLYQIMLVDGSSENSSLGREENSTTPSEESSHRTKSSLTKPNELEFSEENPKSVSTKKVEKTEFVATNGDGDELEPRKKPQNWNKEKSIFAGFVNACKDAGLPEPEPMQLWQLKQIRKVLKTNNDDFIAEVLEDWLQSAGDEVILNIHSALSSHNINRLKAKGFKNKPRSNSKYDKLKIIKTNNENS